MNPMTHNGLAREIVELEKIMMTLTRLPRLMRAAYWIARVEQLLGAPGISAHDTARLVQVLEQIGACHHRGLELPLAA